MDKDLTCDGTKEQWGMLMLRQDILVLQEAMAKVLVPAFRQLTDAIRAFRAFVIQLQRAQLGTRLAQRWWIPERFTHWLSDKWPERWLPELRFE